MYRLRRQQGGKRMKRGKLISLEGIDGVGKTTCAAAIIELLNSENQKCIYMHRKEIPKDNEYIKNHMEYLSDLMWSGGKVFSMAPNIPYNGLNREHWRHLMLAWYYAFEQYMILPKLEAGVSIVTDGYVYKEMVKAIHSTGDFNTGKEFEHLYKPDIVCYLTTAPENCLREDSSTNRIESGTFVDMDNDFVQHQGRMQLIYQKLAKDNEWAVVERNIDASITCQNIIKELKTKLPERFN